VPAPAHGELRQRIAALNARALTFAHSRRRAIVIWRDRILRAWHIRYSNRCNNGVGATALPSLGRSGCSKRACADSAEGKPTRRGAQDSAPAYWPWRLETEKTKHDVASKSIVWHTVTSSSSRGDQDNSWFLRQRRVLLRQAALTLLERDSIYYYMVRDLLLLTK